MNSSEIIYLSRSPANLTKIQTLKNEGAFVTQMFSKFMRIFFGAQSRVISKRKVRSDQKSKVSEILSLSFFTGCPSVGILLSFGKLNSSHCATLHETNLVNENVV